MILILLLLTIFYISINTWWKEHDVIMIGLFKKIFVGLLTGLVNGSNHTKCVSLCVPNKQKI